MYIDPVTKCQFPYTPFGQIIHTPPFCPRTDWANDFGRPWWKNDSYCIGLLTQKIRKIRIVNTLTSQEQRLEVSTTTRCIKKFNTFQQDESIITLIKMQQCISYDNWKRFYCDFY